MDCAERGRVPVWRPALEPVSPPRRTTVEADPQRRRRLRVGARILGRPGRRHRQGRGATVARAYERECRRGGARGWAVGTREPHADTDDQRFFFRARLYAVIAAMT